MDFCLTITTCSLNGFDGNYFHNETGNVITCVLVNLISSCLFQSADVCLFVSVQGETEAGGGDTRQRGTTKLGTEEFICGLLSNY